MDIKFSSVRAVLLIAILTLVVGTTSAGYRPRGPRRYPSRRQNRREVRDHLAPPAQDASYTSYDSSALEPPPLIPYRPGHGQFINPPPPPSTEAPGYFSRLASWLNPFGGSPTPPPLPERPSFRYPSKYGPPDTYGPPSQSYGPPALQPPPPGPYGYRPAKVKGKNCNPCNNVPWIPLPGVAQKDAYGASTQVDIVPDVSQEAKNAGESSVHSEEVPRPDFSYGPPQNSQSHQGPSGPIPYPHLYPGPMPPLYKAKPFNDHTPGSFQPTQSIEINTGPTVSGPDHVEVLPPGAEVDTSGPDSGLPTGYAGEIRDTPPPGYQENNHGNGHDSTSLNFQQSSTIHEEHISTQLNAGYGVQGPTNVEIVKSIPSAEYSAAVDYPIQYQQSPVIDLTQKQPEDSGSEYTPGLNPPPIGQSYGSGPTIAPGNVLKNSYGEPVGNPSEAPIDSLSASTVTNRTVIEPTSAYGIPDVGGLPISHDTSTVNNYENYPPSTEKFLISVQDPVSTDDIQRINVSSRGQGEGRFVDSYQQNIEPGQSGPQNAPVPLVPYRPSPLYVPYPPYTGPNGGQSGPPPTNSGPTTEEPFLDALLKSYDSFKQEMAAKDQLLVRDQKERIKESQRNEAASGGTTWVSQPQPSFALPEQINPSVYVSGELIPPPLPAKSYGTNNQQQTGPNRNKQVQIIIPYTSQYTPSPFQPVTDDWSGRGPLEQTPQGRRVPDLESHDHVGQDSNIVQVTKTLRPLENLLMKEVKRPESTKQTNNSIDVTKLQKNIDNWTIQEYSRGITSSTALPSSSHPYLLPSKKIPNEYLSSNKSSVSQERIDTNQSDLPGLNDNGVEQEGAASSRIDVPHIQVLSIDGVPKPFEREAKSSGPETTPPSASSTSTTTPASWDELPVSISPHNNERVYVVTPQPVRSPKSWSDFEKPDKPDKYEAIERAYQVLPQAVNNLASASVSGPEDSPLWGIMDHDQYARNDKGNSTNVPILYSGHSKVSNARSH